jgi:phosphohistidine phosphatase SixA
LNTILFSRIKRLSTLLPNKIKTVVKKTAMRKIMFLIGTFITIGYLGCTKKDATPPEPISPKITSVEFENDLLFVNNNDFQIETSEPADFASADPLITISSTGLIKRITSAEVVAIDVTWKSSGVKTRFYALGATESNFDQPYLSFHAASATDPQTAYKAGWQTLRKLPVTQETYAIILRHADADNGKDYVITPTDQGPANWWKSCDNSLARQLNAQGISRATELGKIFKDLNFPITRVVSSEFCRSVKTAELINAGPAIVTDGRINHPAYNKSGKGLFPGMIEIVKSFPVDNQMSLIVSHHPINELRSSTYPTFPNVSPYSWTGGYLIKIAPDKTITYEGAVSWGMFKYWRNLKLKRL